MACRRCTQTNQQSTSLAGIKYIPKTVPRLALERLTLHDCGRGKRDRQSARKVAVESANQITCDLVFLVTRETAIK